MWKPFLVSGVLVILVAWASACNGNKTENKNRTPTMTSPGIPAPDYGQFDRKRVDDFLDEFKKPTQHLASERRSEELDKRIREAGLSLADKIESLKRLAPAADA